MTLTTSAGWQAATATGTLGEEFARGSIPGIGVTVQHDDDSGCGGGGLAVHAISQPPRAWGAMWTDYALGRG
jgi:hypothetical protein